MNEGLTPREHVELRESIVAGVGRLRAARARRSRILAGAAAAAAVAVVVAGVAITASMPPNRTTTPIETIAPSPSASTSVPTPSPSAPLPSPSKGAADRTVTAPTIVFDGSCDVVADPASLGTLWSGGAVSALSYSGEEYIRTLGGLSCGWRFDDGTFINADVYPLVVVPDGIRERYSGVFCGTSTALGISCSEAVGDSSTWMLIELGGDQYQRVGQSNSPDEDLMRARLAAVLPLFEESLGRAGAGSPASIDPAGWAGPTCDELASHLPLAELLNSDNVEPDPPRDSGPSVAQEIAESAGAFQRCSWWVPDRVPFTTLTIAVYRGAAWDWERISTVPSTVGTHLVDVSIPGAHAAVSERLDSDSSINGIYLTDGVDVVIVRSAGDVVAAATAALVALS